MKAAAIFAVGWLTGSHAGYTAGAESEHVRIDARATLPTPASPEQFEFVHVPINDFAEAL
jgi:hypothetical protein